MHIYMKWILQICQNYLINYLLNILTLFLLKETHFLSDLKTNKIWIYLSNFWMDLYLILFRDLYLFKDVFIVKIPHFLNLKRFSNVLLKFIVQTILILDLKKDFKDLEE